MENKEELLEKIADIIVEKQMAIPAIFFLEMTKQLSFIANQFMEFLNPLVRTVIDVKSYTDIKELLNDRNNIELLLQKIESKEKREA